jgi:hypothetical protein
MAGPSNRVERFVRSIAGRAERRIRGYRTFLEWGGFALFVLATPFVLSDTVDSLQGYPPLGYPGVWLSLGVALLLTGLHFFHGLARRGHAQLVASELVAAATEYAERQDALGAYGADTRSGRALRRQVVAGLLGLLMVETACLVTGFTIVLAAKSGEGWFEPRHITTANWSATTLTEHSYEHLARVAIDAVPGLDATSTLHWERDPWPFTDVASSLISLAFRVCVVVLIARAILRIVRLLEARHWQETVDRVLTPETWDTLKKHYPPKPN